MTHTKLQLLTLRNHRVAVSQRAFCLDRVHPCCVPHEPFTVKIRAILVQTKRSPKNSFGAALHTMSFDRVNGDKTAVCLQLIRIICTSACKSAIYNLPFCQQDGARATFTKKCVRRRLPHNTLRSRERWYLGGLILPLLNCMYIKIRSRKYQPT
jgi:hypothetical protein